MKHIIVIGDSHSANYCDDVNRLSWFSLGAPTAHNILDPENRSQSVEKLSKRLSELDPSNCIVILCVGEIDCRIHIFYQHKKAGRSMNSLIRETVTKYMEAVDYVKNKGFQVGIHGIPPGSRQENIYNYPYAEQETRAWINRRYNKYLSAFCKRRNIPYFDAYCGYADKDGVITQEASPDGVHLCLQTGVTKKLLNWVRSWET